jgi:hypothetical protein
MLSAMSPDQRSLLYREVNDRIYELLESADPDLPGEFLCECGRDCGRRIELVAKEFAEVRKADGLVRSPDCGAKFASRGLRSRLARGTAVLG